MFWQRYSSTKGTSFITELSSLYLMSRFFISPVIINNAFEEINSFLSMEFLNNMSMFGGPLSCNSTSDQLKTSMWFVSKLYKRFAEFINLIESLVFSILSEKFSIMMSTISYNSEL